MVRFGSLRYRIAVAVGLGAHRSKLPRRFLRSLSGLSQTYAGRAREARYFQDQGFEVPYRGPAGLPSDQQAIQPEQLFNWVHTHVPDEAEAVFIGGNGFRAISVIEALEDNLGQPVLTANQVAFWCALRLSGARVPVTGYGNIFACDLPHV